MKFFTLPALAAALLFSAVVAVPFLPATRAREGVFVVEARMTSSVTGYVQVYYDSGAGLREYDSSRLPVEKVNSSELYRLPLPPGHYVGFRFDPIDRGGKVTIESLRVVARSGRVIRTLALTDLQPANQIASLRNTPAGLEAVVPLGANDPQLTLALSPPLDAIATWHEITAGLLPRTFGVFAALAALLLTLDLWPGLRAGLSDVADRFRSRPGRALAMVAAIAVIASAYPVIFLGKSFVSPNFGTTLLYDGFPTLPGYADNDPVNSQGADVGAIMWAHVPYSFVQHRALAQGELPLWNRYNNAGSPLLGQGQSMFGDPLHFLVIFANGASWAWDLKYLVAKWLFALALGLLVLAVLKDQETNGPRDQRTFAGGDASPLVPSSLGPLVPALLVSAAAPFVGFFIYRINHPAFFSLCYAPWALYCWVRVAQAAGARATAWWAAGLILANGAVMNSGTAKEAYMLLLTMNFSGACVLLASDTPWRTRLAKLAGLAWAGAIFALLTAPVWATFLHTLSNAQTAYDAPAAFQIQPALLLGLFDELFYRPLMSQNFVFDPSLNFLLLLGILYFLATLRGHFANRLALGLALSALVPLALAFGLVPPQWIVQVPFLANVAHIDNTFSCALIILGAVLAGVGFAAAAARLGTREGRTDLAIAALLLFALVFAWVAFRQTVHRSIFGPGLTFSVLQNGQVIPVSTFVWGSLVVLLLASVIFAWAGRRGLARNAFTPPLGITLALCALVMLWRNGMQAKSVGFEEFVVRPTERVNFLAKSPAVEFLRAAQAREPLRAFGLHGNFFPGWTGVYGLETINSPDALMNRWFHELVAASGIDRPWIWDLGVAPENVGKIRPVFDALNVRYYLDRNSDPAVLTRALKFVESADLDIYESVTAWPRAFFTDRLEVYDDPAGFVNTIRAGDGRPFAGAQRNELTETPPLLGVPRGLDGRTVAAATNYRLTENTTSFDVHASGPGVVVLNEVFWPGDFRAEINGRKAPVVRMNHAFKAVLLDMAGDYHVTFRYVPRNFPRNLMLCGLGAFLLASSLALATRQPKLSRPPS